MQNELELTERSYEAALRRAKDAEGDDNRHHHHDTHYQRGREREWFHAIRRDAQVTFPELKIFQANGPLHDSLVDVLMAHAMYRPDVGYLHGTHVSFFFDFFFPGIFFIIFFHIFFLKKRSRNIIPFWGKKNFFSFIVADLEDDGDHHTVARLQVMAGLLLLNLPASQSFIVLSNVLNHSLPLAFLTKDLQATTKIYQLTVDGLRNRLPALYHHLTINLGLPAHLYLERMFRTLFANTLGLDHVSRVWDVYVFEADDAFLIRTALALFTVLEPTLYRTRADVLALLGWGSQAVCQVGSEEDFMLAVRRVGNVT